MALTDENSYSPSVCPCETLFPRYSYSFAPWLATTRRRYSNCTCGKSQFGSGHRPPGPVRKNTATSQTGNAGQHQPTSMVSSLHRKTLENVPTRIISSTTIISDTNTVRPKAGTTPTPGSTMTAPTPIVPADGFCGIWTMLIQPVWASIVEKFMSWVWKMVFPPPVSSNQPTVSSNPP
ncbi:hypothetical protein L211DRAFT_351346 [Terfezia boudieri ATCC MYA-4762]|uniref:Uncharacterized protein n=1 Tax=Terfezia boudieri ATCC MYA-4762 TaxID=1051890 RepID=A0A3N4LH20_9PEZI|nr:hypothetical protein L211DRAFT_351346 [Terfezia boudieri ATCC MYA-4762]